MLALQHSQTLSVERPEIPAELRKKKSGCRAAAEHSDRKTNNTKKWYKPSVIAGKVIFLPNKMEIITVLTRLQREYQECSIIPLSLSITVDQVRKRLRKTGLSHRTRWHQLQAAEIPCSHLPPAQGWVFCPFQFQHNTSITAQGEARGPMVYSALSSCLLYMSLSHPGVHWITQPLLDIFQKRTNWNTGGVMKDLVNWCGLNHLHINTSKTKEMVIPERHPR